jgi:hypothetical protein
VACCQEANTASQACRSGSLVLAASSATVAAGQPSAKPDFSRASALRWKKSWMLCARVIAGPGVDQVEEPQITLTGVGDGLGTELLLAAGKEVIKRAPGGLAGVGDLLEAGPGIPCCRKSWALASSSRARVSRVLAMCRRRARRGGAHRRVCRFRPRRPGPCRGPGRRCRRLLRRQRSQGDGSGRVPGSDSGGSPAAGTDTAAPDQAGDRGHRGRSVRRGHGAGAVVRSAGRRLIGQGRALDLLLTGRQILADEAFRIGLEDRGEPGKAHGAGQLCRRCPRAQGAGSGIPAPRRP